MPDVEQIQTEILADPAMKELRQGPALKVILRSLTNGFIIEGSSDHQDSCSATSATQGVTAHLVMRSLIGLMAAAAVALHLNRGISVGGSLYCT